MTSARDLAAFEAFALAKKFHVPTAPIQAQLSTEDGVFVSLAHLLRQIEARIEDPEDPGTFESVAFAAVYAAPPAEAEPPIYPSAQLAWVTDADLASVGFVPELARRSFAPVLSSMSLVPVVEDGEDVVTDDWALWKLGEEAGVGIVKISTTDEIEARALAHAVRETLAGSIDAWAGALLPMPELSLPPPFREHFSPERTPACHLSLRDARGRPVLDAEASVWSVDIEFAWRATRFTARPRIADFRPFVTVET